MKNLTIISQLSLWVVRILFEVGHLFMSIPKIGNIYQRAYRQAHDFHKYKAKAYTEPCQTSMVQRLAKDQHHKCFTDHLMSMNLIMWS